MTAISAVIFLVSAEYDMATSYIIGRVENNGYGLAIAYSTVLVKATYVGSRMEYLVATDLGGLFVASEDVGDIFAAGAEVDLVLAESGPVLIPANDSKSR